MPSTIETANRRGQTTPMHEEELMHEEERSAEVLTGGSLVEAACGAGARVLAILGLVGIFPNHLLSIATIALGCGSAL
jgi:hypothetical protein